VLLLCAIPLQFVSAPYHRWISRKAKPVNAEEPEKEEKEFESIVDKRQSTQSEYGQTRSRKRALHDAHSKVITAQSSAQIKAPIPQRAVPEIWRPPPPAYDDSPYRAPVGLPTPPSEAQMLPPLNQNVDEWHQYEAFPSAYPATPHHSTSGLPSSNYATPLSAFTAAAERVSDETADQGFRRSLESLRESENPDYEGDLSDDLHETNGVHTDDEMSVEEDYEEEDDFNVTLQTPYPLSRIVNVSGMTAGSQDSTGLDTFDEDSPLQSRTNSQSSTYSQADASPTTRKRRLPSPAQSTVSSRTTRPKTPDQATIRARAVPARPTIRPPLASRKQSRGGESSEAQDQEETSSVVKKQRAEMPAGSRRTNARPLPTKQEPNKAPPRKVPTSTAPRAPLRTTTRTIQRPTVNKEPKRTAEVAKEVSAVDPVVA
jgi:hypothetical protein